MHPGDRRECTPAIRGCTARKDVRINGRTLVYAEETKS